MATEYSSGVWRQEVTGTNPSGVDTPAVLMIPEGVFDLTIYAVGSAATSCKIEESASSPTAIQTTTGDVWQSVDATLDSVSTTQVKFALGNNTPVALKVTALTSDESATLILVGKRLR